MKKFVDYIREDMPANAVSGGQVASLGVGESGEPPAKKKTKLLTRKKPQG